MKQQHICIYTTKDVLKHKKNEGGYMYWELPNTPRLLQDIDKKIDDGKYKGSDEREIRLYFAIRKNIIGYFIISDWNTCSSGYCEINFDSDTWHNVKPTPQKAFQGFKYINEI